MSEGYSGTPLARKLGYLSTTLAAVQDAPANYLDWLQPLPEGVRWLEAADARCTLVHAFYTERARLAADLQLWRTTLAPTVALWISWPKQRAGLPTDITEDVIRAECLPLGWVDVKVCAVSAQWSGLKLMIRKALR